MSFKKFQESKKFITDKDDPTLRGFIYFSQPDHSPYCYENLFIELNFNPTKGNKYCLTILNDSFGSDDLELLEKKLYFFAMGEGWEDFSNISTKLKQVNIDSDQIIHYESCAYCGSAMDQGQTYYFNSNDDDGDNFYCHPSCVEIHHLIINE